MLNVLTVGGIRLAVAMRLPQDRGKYIIRKYETSSDILMGELQITCLWQ
jgi:hypothetical protein